MGLGETPGKIVSVEDSASPVPRQPQAWHAPKFFVESVEHVTNSHSGSGADIHPYTQQFS
jgi:hypothetical protein